MSYIVKELLIDALGEKAGTLLINDQIYASEYFIIDIETGQNKGWMRTRLGEKKLITLGHYDGKNKGIGHVHSVMPADAHAQLSEWVKKARFCDHGTDRRKPPHYCDSCARENLMDNQV